MQYNNSVGVTSCDAGYTGHPSVDTIYCSNDDSWDGVTGCEKIGMHTGHYLLQSLVILFLTQTSNYKNVLFY